MRHSLSYIVKTSDPYFSEMDKHLAGFLLKVIKNNPEKLNAFKVHTKGMGLVCNE